jgi:excisionase family DNA binding protein
MNSNKLEKLLTVKETADYLRISERTIYNRIGRKSKMAFPIKPKRIGRLIRFDQQDVAEFIKSL